MNNSNYQIIRSNQNGVMFRTTTLHLPVYTIYSLRSRSEVYSSTNPDAARNHWNRNFRNSRQYATPNGVNHIYLS